MVAAAESVDQTHKFELLTGKTNILGGCEISLERVASLRGQEAAVFLVRKRGQEALHLCGVILVSEAAVFAWSGYVPAGRNSQQYRPYLEMTRDGKRKRRTGRLRRYQGPAPELAVPIPLFVKILRYGSLVEEFIQPIWVSQDANGANGRGIHIKGPRS